LGTVPSLSGKPPTSGYPRARLLDRVREAVRARHYSRRAEKAYVAWTRRYVLFHGKRHPIEMGAAEVSRFLTSLATEAKVAASTQNQALNALLFLYRVVLERDLPWLNEVVRARRPQHLPVVLNREEVRVILDRLDGTPRSYAICRGTRRRHDDDLRRGAGWVELPDALARKYPNAGREWGWQWVFPATRIYVDHATGQRRRHHLHESVPRATPRLPAVHPGSERPADAREPVETMDKPPRLPPRRPALLRCRRHSDHGATRNRPIGVRLPIEARVIGRE
jgi:Phage integrase, N-terminal SAM-like domain